MTRAAPFKQSSITKAVKGAKAAGFEVGKLEIGIDGRIVLWPGGPNAEADPSSNPWDKVLDDGEKA